MTSDGEREDVLPEEVAKVLRLYFLGHVGYEAVIAAVVRYGDARAALAQTGEAGVAEKAAHALYAAGRRLYHAAADDGDEAALRRWGDEAVSVADETLAALGKKQHHPLTAPLAAAAPPACDVPAPASPEVVEAPLPSLARGREAIEAVRAHTERRIDALIRGEQAPPTRAGEGKEGA